MTVWAVFTAACLVSASVGFWGGWRARDAGHELEAASRPLDVIEPPARYEQVRRISIFDWENDR